MIQANKLSTFVATLLCVISLQAFAANTDAVVLSNVKKSFAESKVVVPSSLKVSVKNGVVFLQGNVETEGLADAVIEAANSTSGVRDVNYDNLTVNNQSHQPYKDAYITAKVKGAFVREKAFGVTPVNVTGVKVETENGIVYLTGSATKTQVDNAKRIASSIRGVREVKCNVVIQ